MPDTTVTDPKPLLERTRRAMPGISETETALVEVSERLRQAQAARQQPETGPVQRALADILAGKPATDDLADQVVSIRRSNELAVARAGALTELERQLQGRLCRLHIERADDALVVLAVELSELLAKARPVIDALGDVSNPSEAISSDRVEQWREAGRVCAQYGELRAAQSILVSGAITPIESPSRVTTRATREASDLVADFGYVARPDEHFGDVGTPAARRPDSQSGETKIIGGRVFTSTISEQSGHPRPWLTGDSLTDLKFVTRPDVEAWVPSVAGLRAARDEHEKRERAEAREAADTPRRAIARMPASPPVAFIPTDSTNNRRTG